MNKLTIRNIRSELSALEQFRCQPLLVATFDPESMSYHLSLQSVDSQGDRIPDSDRFIFDGRGKQKTIKSLTSVYNFATRYAINPEFVEVRNK